MLFGGYIWVYLGLVLFVGSFFFLWGGEGAIIFCCICVLLVLSCGCFTILVVVPAEFSNNFFDFLWGVL